MNRSVVFIDADYMVNCLRVWASGIGMNPECGVDVVGLVAGLKNETVSTAETQPLRVYWYTSSPEVFENPDAPSERVLMTIPDLKVRTIDPEEEDPARVISEYMAHDIVTLAGHKAVTDMMVLSPDEGLIDIIEEAQSFGIRVHLWDIGLPAEEHGQSDAMMYTADRINLIEASWLGRFLIQKDFPPEEEPAIPVVAQQELSESAVQMVTAAVAASPAQSAANARVDVETTSYLQSIIFTTPSKNEAATRVIEPSNTIHTLGALTSPAQANLDLSEDQASGTLTIGDIGERYGARWSQRSTADQRDALASRYEIPDLPPDIASELNAYASRMGVQTTGNDLVHHMLALAFWAKVTRSMSDEYPRFKDIGHFE